MIKKSILIALASIISIGAAAESLTPEQALARVSSDAGAKKIISRSEQPRLEFTATTSTGDPAVYVFNTAGNALIVSADDVALPLLGYTDSGTFDPSNIPPQLQDWISEYAAQIAAAKAAGFEPVNGGKKASFPSSWKAIEPYCKTQWDQSAPYNEKTPNNWPTGCVATAMAQVMKYWNYPDKGRGSITYTSETNKLNLTMSFNRVTFDWNNMLDIYLGVDYTEAQASAVAVLMQACGYATQMDYCWNESGTTDQKAATALKSYFNYDSSLCIVNRYGLTTSEWAEIIYDQLANVGPIMYRGKSLDQAAHEFVCDGYNGDGLFHFNWGWSGLCDGYYSLDALNPQQQGIGSSFGGYNFLQGIIINIKPATGETAPEQPKEFLMLGNLSATNASSTLTFSISGSPNGILMNTSLSAIEPYFGMCIENETTGSTNYVPLDILLQGNKYQSLGSAPSGAYLDMDLKFTGNFLTTLPNGTYKVTLVWKNGEKGDWVKFTVAPGDHDYVYVTKNVTLYTVENLPAERFIIDSAKILETLYLQKPCPIEFTLTNPNDTELTQSVVPVLLLNGKPNVESESQLFTLGPNETITVTRDFTFYGMSGATLPTDGNPMEYEFAIYDYNLVSSAAIAAADFSAGFYDGDFGSVTLYADPTGVAGPLADDVVSVTVFDLNGNILSNSPEGNFTTLPKGIYIVKTTNLQGETKVEKIIK